MILEKEYLRDNVVLYAEKYALVRNPLFYTFEGIGGNCTNFASQCVLAGSCTMNYTSIYGWYYLSVNRRSASWTGVDFFYNFMTSNQGVGPFGRDVDISLAQIGDIIQLKNAEGDFYHSLVITRIEENEIYICANSNDALNRALSTYDYSSLRVIHIDGVRYDSRFIIDCFDSLYSPPLPPAPTPTPPTEGEGDETIPPTESGGNETIPPMENETMPPIDAIN
ncbi:MAG: amidase domain-containing protein [Clostridia bacterium]|nr:amidase domain-containing protein [Clostridia bacterium]